MKQWLAKSMMMGLLPVILLGCGDQAVQPSAEPETVSASVMTLQPVVVASHYVTSGVVVSDQRISVSSRLSGYIREMAVREGDRVKEGQLLFRIDPVDARQAYEQAQAHLSDALTDFRRYQSLLAEHAISQQQFDKAKLRYTVARSRLLQAKNQLQYAEVKAPVSGVVVEKHASAGDLASPGRAVLVLDNPAQLLVETHISDQFIAALHEGDEADVYLPGSKVRVTGVIRQIVEAADPVTHQFLVKVALKSMVDVFPGMFAEVRFAVGQREALMLPAEVLVHRAGLDGVYIVDGDGVIHYRLVRLGEVSDGQVEILAGLQAGDTIAWSNGRALSSGMRVGKQAL